MKFFLALCSMFFLVMILSAGATGAYFLHQFYKPGPLREATLIVIEPGSTLSQIAQTLHDEGAIEKEVIFKIAGRLSRVDSTLKAGEYELQPNMSMAGIMNVLHEGKTFQRLVTVREGLTSYEIVQLLNRTPDLSGKITAIPVEGSLLPDSYSHSKDESRAAILERMSASMKALREELLASKATEPAQANAVPPSVVKLCSLSSDVTTLSDECWNKIITLASIVEKETGKPEERPRVAGVFLNRLERGIALQTDPTVIYAITKGEHKNDGKGPLGRRLLSKDLEIDSPYNTYKYPGLPPGPIANPGRASIEAVLFPENHDYIYFVADGTGGHVFAKTLAEHNANVVKWRKIRKASGK